MATKNVQAEWSDFLSVLLIRVAEYMDVCESFLLIPHVCTQWRMGLQECHRREIMVKPNTLSSCSTSAKLATIINSVHPSSVNSIVLANVSLCVHHGFGHIAKLRELRHLDLHSDKCVYTGLTSCTKLESAPQLFDIICTLHNLRTLNLSRTTYPIDDSIGMIAINLPHLESLNVSETGITDEGIGYLVTMKNLRDLDIMRTHTTIACMQSIMCMQLHRLCIFSNEWLNDACCADLAKMTSLQDLFLGSRRKITDTGVKHLSALVNLERLKIMSETITDVGTTCLAQLPHLTALDVSHCCNLSQNYLQAFIDAKTRLRKLVSSHTTINTMLLPHFSATLEELDLSFTLIGSTNLRVIALCVNLRKLDIRKTKVTYNDQTYLHDLMQLQEFITHI